MASQKELVEELNKFRVEVSKLRQDLDKLDSEKESWYRKKADCSKKIKELIQKIKEDKVKRDSLTQEVKEQKRKRDDSNRQIGERLEKFKSIKEDKSSLAKALKLRESPSRINDLIEKLEFSIETDALSFDKEQALMKKIKELKRIYSDSRDVLEMDKKARDIFESVKKTKKGANELHESIQDKAKQSQTLHEGILKISGEIDKLKADEEEAFKKFSEFKQKFTEANIQLKEKLKSMNEVKGRLDMIFADKKEKRKNEIDLMLKAKEEEVNMKIRLGKKLTTEDLLVFQKTERR